MDNSIEAKALARTIIKRHEGYTKFPKPDAKNSIEIGYGTNLTLRGISPGEADWLLMQDVNRLEGWLSSFPFFDGLSANRKAALLDMAYDVGDEGIDQFGKMIGWLLHGDFEHAALEMLDSAWAREVPSRAQDDAQLMRQG